MLYYRYIVDKQDWPDSDEDWQQFINYARAHFHHVVASVRKVFFNTTPKELLEACNTLNISTIGFNILTSSNLEPSHIH